MSFDLCQIFYINPSLVENSPTVAITAIDLYFQSVPMPTNNQSGINFPGVSVAIVPTNQGVPVIDNLSAAPWVYLPYSSIYASTIAAIPTTFRWNVPVQVSSGKLYAIIVAYDGGESFVLWTDKSGENIVSATNTTAISTGPSDPNMGALYDYISPLPQQQPTQTGNIASMLLPGTGNASPTANAIYTWANWNPIASTWLKCTIYIARYAIDGNYDLGNFYSSVQIHNQGNTSANGDNGLVTYTMPASRTEYLAYDRPTSLVVNAKVGELAYQNTCFWPDSAWVSANVPAPATVSVQAGSTNVTAVSNLNWNSFLQVGGPTPEFIVLQGLNQFGAGADAINIRQIVSVVSNTQIIVTPSVTFTNAVCNFMRAPVGFINEFLYNERIFGPSQDMVVLSNSTANTSIRFANDVIQSANIVSGGTGYANTDYVVWSGFESVAGKIIGGYDAQANITTNSTGGIVSLRIGNVGCGFGKASNVNSFSILNATANLSLGTGANLVANVGCLIKTESFAYMNNAHTLNMELDLFSAGLLVSNPGGTAYSASIQFPYYQITDNSVSYGIAYYCDGDGNWDTAQIQPQIMQNSWTFKKTRVLPSWSQELVIPYANGSPCNGAGGSTFSNTMSLTSNSAVIVVNAVSNSDFVAVALAPGVSTVTYFRYIINDDYTAENTNYGNAWAKGIENSFTLANNFFAEDLIVYGTVYQPLATEVLMFAKIYNTSDSDAFFEKDWTMLKLTGGANLFSTLTNPSNYIQLTWGLQSYPNTGPAFAGSANTTLNSNVVSGVGTTWHTNVTANLQANTLIVMYPSLFPNNYMVTLVTAVSNDISFQIADPVANSDLVGGGIVVKPITYPFQAFRNWLNDNVVRYYNSSMVPIDEYNACQFKIVFISSNNILTPAMSGLQGISVSS